MHRRRHASRTSRRGLAPLELVLALPLMCMALALMVVIGTAGAWKVRTLANARQAVFRSTWPRTTDNDAKPANWWPPSATMSYQPADPSPLSQDPFASHSVVRGPTVGDAGGRSLTVMMQTLDMTEGLHTGRASINHEPAMWPQLDRRNRFTRDNDIFAGQTWQFGNLGLPDNLTRRILSTYDYHLGRYDGAAFARVMTAANRLLSYPQRPALVVLDRDAELRAHFGRYSDFHPQPQYLCSNDPTTMRSVLLQDLQDRIRDVPRRMAERFRLMYQQQLDALRAMRPPPPGFAQQEAELLRKIAEMDAFLATLP